MPNCQSNLAIVHDALSILFCIYINTTAYHWADMCLHLPLAVALPISSEDSNSWPTRTRSRRRSSKVRQCWIRTSMDYSIIRSTVLPKMTCKIWKLWYPETTGIVFQKSESQDRREVRQSSYTYRPEWRSPKGGITRVLRKNIRCLVLWIDSFKSHLPP